ncbi:MAG TPA: hypothetical protein VIX73_00165, partial [Kofleriaceae bacterium]
VAIAFAAAAMLAGVLVARTSIGDSLTRGGLERRTIDGVPIQVPAGWEAPVPPDQTPAQLAQPDGLVVVAVIQAPRDTPAEQLRIWTAAQRKRIKVEEGIDDANPVEPSLIALPTGWDGSELLAVAAEDPMGYRERWRVVVCSRAFGARMVFAAIYVPETIAAAAPEFFAQLLASIGPV